MSTVTYPFDHYNIFRNTKEMYDDLVMEIACGLHNFRVEYRHSETPNSYSR
jgi:hypothetical protein